MQIKFTWAPGPSFSVASRNLIGYFSGRVRGVGGLLGVTRMAASVRD